MHTIWLPMLNEEDKGVIARQWRHIGGSWILVTHAYPIVTVICFYRFVSFVRTLAFMGYSSIHSLIY